MINDILTITPGEDVTINEWFKKKLQIQIVLRIQILKIN